MDLSKCNTLLTKFAETLESPLSPLSGKQLYTGVDLGTAYIVLAVVDEDGNPVAGRLKFAQVVKDGLVVDFSGAVQIVRSLKAEIEKELNRELELAAIAYPPGTGGSDSRAIKYVAEAAGFEVIGGVDEPTAANYVLKVQNGAVIDIGGGTTGTAVFQNNEVTHVEDDPTGGTQFTLVISGRKKISFEEAEAIKKDPLLQEELFPIIKPVMQKVASLIRSHLKGHPVKTLYLVGGTSTNKYIGHVIQEETGLNVITPMHPFLVTPLGIALYARDSEEMKEG